MFDITTLTPDQLAALSPEQLAALAGHGVPAETPAAVPTPEETEETPACTHKVTKVNPDAGDPSACKFCVKRRKNATPDAADAAAHRDALRRTDAAQLAAGVRELRDAEKLRDKVEAARREDGTVPRMRALSTVTDLATDGLSVRRWKSDADLYGDARVKVTFTDKRTGAADEYVGPYSSVTFFAESDAAADRLLRAIVALATEEVPAL